jgi:hypothetical protein
MASEDFIGLTKREYFAAMIIQGLSSFPVGNSLEHTLNTKGITLDQFIAREAVERADALIEELNKKEETT